MVNKISKILILFILLFTVGISKTYAYTYYSKTINIKNELYDTGLITYNWVSRGDDILAADNMLSLRYNHSTWVFHYVKDNNTYYISYCLNIGRGIGNEKPVSYSSDLTKITFNTDIDKTTKNNRIELLKKLLLYGYNPDPTHTQSLETVIDNDPKAQLKLIAMQVLIWEVMEGGRTTFDTVAPNVYNGSKSLYNVIIAPNGSDDTKKTDTLWYYYNTYRLAAKQGDQANPSTAFNSSTYTMKWNPQTKKYTATVTGLGDYTSCESSTPNVKVSVSNSTATVTAEHLSNATITCKYYRGSGASSSTSTESFNYFKFGDNACGENINCQNIINGSGYKIYTKSFNVVYESTNVLIKKVDTEGQKVSGAKFTLTYIPDTSYKISFDGNGSEKDITASGIYKVSETTTPDGYETIRDFNITIDAVNKRITACDGSSPDLSKCLNGQVKVSYSNNTINLEIVNVAKNFKIRKVDRYETPINGATFEIRDKNNNVLKFTKTSQNIFKYDPSGNLTRISDSQMSLYPISLLPEGEYRIVEVAVPAPYKLPRDESKRTTWIKIDSRRNVLVYSNSRKTYVSTLDEVLIYNYIPEVIIHKVGNGESLGGVKFELYNEDKTVQIKSRGYGGGTYEYAEDQASESNTIYETGNHGLIYVTGLPEGTYYFKEVETISPFVLPSGDGVYTKVEISIDEKGVSINGNSTLNEIEISNTPNSFNFYKRDTEGNALTTGKYKLQKYDEIQKKYVDLKLVEVENDGTYSQNTDIYTVDETNGKIQFSLKKGVATFVNMESGATYRIIETVAPEGYTKASTSETSTVHIDEYGNASGLLVLIDQKIVKEDDSAFAELIINIQTGKQRIMYAAVIFVVIGIIAGLIVYNKRK